MQLVVIALWFGEDVLTAGGEIIGLFLERQVERGLRPRETALDIKSQGGLVYLEHPYDPLRRHLGEASFETIGDLVEIVEVYNGRSDEPSNQRAQDLCEIH